MILGRVAVGAIIFFATCFLLSKLNEWFNGDGSAVDMSGLGIVVILIFAIYCTASGLYLLCLKGLL